MCTLIVAKGLYADYPLVIAANRDEDLSRPSEGPSIREDVIVGGRPHRVLAPKDLIYGGTWMGVNNSGIFVGLTNRTDCDSQPKRALRGHLVTTILYMNSMDAIFQYLKSLDGNRQNSYNLIVANKDQIFLVRADCKTVMIDSIPIDYRGVVVATNHGIGTETSSTNARRVNNVLETWNASNALKTTPCTRSLKTLLNIHDEWRHGTCINEPARDYGTKSSGIIRLNKTKNEWEYWHRDRSSELHICKDAFRTYMRLPLD